MSTARLQASLAQATNEVTVAAANINFDFCLVNFEAPKEYRPVGELLSAQRKEDAEHDESHVTAHRLAALFDGSVQTLRNSSRRMENELRKSLGRQSIESLSDKMLSAIHVHLLACMLASMFDAVKRLVSGVLQEVQDGSAILGLAAWHIYPDINVFGSKRVEVLMNDPLVARGGILSLGCSPSAT
ncbi:hypothetical protein CIB48_g10256 [Xylaria polymorpha]|nr:hypothetical protein CIB48_g10256 [Xylaria polymorpha]